MIGLRFPAILGLFALFAIPASVAQEKTAEPPAPPSVPVAPVDSATLNPWPPTELEGSGRAIDGDEIAMGDILFHLDGIAAPDMTAPEGPEARVALSALIDGQRLVCKVFDRGADPNDLGGQCLVNGDDVAEALLAQGLVAVYRLAGSASADAATRERQARYDAAENEARARKLGLWTASADTSAEIASEPTEESASLIAGDVKNSWLKQMPILGLAVLALGGLALALASRRRDRRRRASDRDRALLAVLLAEILAIRTAASSALEASAGLIQDLPIPNAQFATISLPPATVFQANAHRLTHLPRSISIDLVQFQARHASLRAMLAQGQLVHCDQLRASLADLVSAADDLVARADSFLD